MTEHLVVTGIALTIALAFLGAAMTIAIKNHRTQSHLSLWAMTRNERADDEQEYLRQTYVSPVIGVVICLFLAITFIGAWQ